MGRPPRRPHYNRSPSRRSHYRAAQRFHAGLLSRLLSVPAANAANLSTWLFELQKYCRAQAYAT